MVFELLFRLFTPWYKRRLRGRRNAESKQEFCQQKTPQ